MTDHTALIATLREMVPVLRQIRADDPCTLPRYRTALRDAADALEAAEMVIEACAEDTGPSMGPVQQARDWRDKYGSAR